MPTSLILILNAGSSSLKLGLYSATSGDNVPILEGSADGVGHDACALKLHDSSGATLREAAPGNCSQQQVLRTFLGWFAELKQPTPVAAGHRVVHGGPHLVAHQRITVELLDQLKDSLHFAPIHIPIALELIEETGRAFPNLPQFACFDTVFHCTLPEAACHYPLPTNFFHEGVRRYGFHGLSYESILHQLGGALPSRTVIAHLGSGASVVAVKDGKSVDTSMGLTPTGGIPMATRTGDLDPGVLLYLMRTRHLDADAFEDLLNHDSGLKALSNGESDMRRLEAAAGAGNQPAQLALEIFSRSIAKTVGAYAAVLGGIDLLVFTGGIGEHSAGLREDVCRRLQFLGVALEQPQPGSSTISATASTIRVDVLPSQEDRQIARHCRRLLLRA